MTLAKLPDSAAAGLAIAQPTQAGRRAAAYVLADAFQDDPIFEWCIPDAERRAAILPDAFAAFVDSLAHHNETYLATAGVQPIGATLGAPAGVEPLTPDAEEALIARLAQLIGPGPDLDRLFQVMELLGDHHPSADAYYLWFIGVVADAQGRGVGSQLLAQITERCDAAGTAAYLEATTPGNRALYERHGFVVLEEISVADSPSLWPMWRAPR
jgi:ribosomal protein S18 acetylase RimI-like enzyme